MRPHTFFRYRTVKSFYPLFVKFFTWFSILIEECTIRKFLIHGLSPLQNNSKHYIYKIYLLLFRIFPSNFPIFPMYRQVYSVRPSRIADHVQRKFVPRFSVRVENCLSLFDLELRLQMFFSLSSYKYIRLFFNRECPYLCIIHIYNVTGLGIGHSILLQVHLSHNQFRGYDIFRNPKAFPNCTDMSFLLGGTVKDAFPHRIASLRIFDRVSLQIVSNRSIRRIVDRHPNRPAEGDGLFWDLCECLVDVCVLRQRSVEIDPKNLLDPDESCNEDR